MSLLKNGDLNSRLMNSWRKRENERVNLTFKWIVKSNFVCQNYVHQLTREVIKLDN